MTTQNIQAANHDVASEAELKAAVISTASGDTITLTTNITLSPYQVNDNSTGKLNIPANKTLTLAGNFKLISTDAQPTITHDPSVVGISTTAGIWINGDNSTFTMLSGKITGNGLGGTVFGAGIHCEGGQNNVINISVGKMFNNVASGTYGYGGAILVMKNIILSGGKIYDNEAVLGGGIFSYMGQTTMSGGEITSNTAPQLGGGIYVNGPSGSLLMSDGLFAGNTAIQGGAILNGGNVDIQGGTLRDNKATAPYDGVNTSGRAICVDDYASLKVGTNANFFNNKASYGYEQHKSIDDAIYTSNILGTK